MLRSIIRSAVIKGRDLFLTCVSYGSYLIGRLRWKQSYIKKTWEGDRPLINREKKVAIFVHFDKFGRVHEFVAHYLRSLGAAGFSVVFVSNSDHLDTRNLDSLRSLCSLIIQRKNVGYDFGAYKDAIAIIGLSDFDQVLLCNDSVYGPFRPFSAILKAVDFQHAAIWGVSDSWERSYHLQSFFLLFGPAALRSAAVQEFWKKLPYVQSKIWVTRHCEVGLSRCMLQAGLRCAALFPYRAIASEFCASVTASRRDFTPDTSEAERNFQLKLCRAIGEGRPLNGSHFFWDRMIESGFPFLKRELLHRNPVRVPALTRWEELIRKISDYDTDLILRHLERSLRDRAF